MIQFSVIGMRPLNFLSPEEFEAYGNDEIQSLAQYYTNEQQHTDTVNNTVFTSPPFINCSVETVLTEWQLCKSVVKSCHYPTGSLTSLWEVLGRFHAQDVPHLLRLVYLAVTHPIHSCDCERTFSVQNLTLTSLRNRMSAEHCDYIMRIIIEGGPIEAFNFPSALEKWRNQKARRIFHNST